MEIKIGVVEVNSVIVGEMGQEKSDDEILSPRLNTGQPEKDLRTIVNVFIDTREITSSSRVFRRELSSLVVVEPKNLK